MLQLIYDWPVKYYFWWFWYIITRLYDRVQLSIYSTMALLNKYFRAMKYGRTEVTCVCFYLSPAHDILSRAHELLKCRAHWLLSHAHDIHWMLFEIGQEQKWYQYSVISKCRMPILRYQRILTLLDIDTFPPSLLFTLVNKNTSIVNTPFFSRRHLIRRKVVH